MKRDFFSFCLLAVERALRAAIYIDKLAVQRTPPSAPESVFDRRGASPLQVYALRPVTNCYCVAVRRGGELQEVNDPSVG